MDIPSGPWLGVLVLTAGLAFVILVLSGSKGRYFSKRIPIVGIVVSAMVTLLGLVYTCTYNYLILGNWAKSRCVERFLLLESDNSGRTYLVGIVLLFASLILLVKQAFIARHASKEERAADVSLSFRAIIRDSFRALLKKSETKRGRRN